MLYASRRYSDLHTCAYFGLPTLHVSGSGWRLGQPKSPKHCIGLHRGRSLIQGMATLSKGCSRGVEQTVQGDRSLTGSHIDKKIVTSFGVTNSSRGLPLRGLMCTLAFPNKLMAKLEKPGLSLLLPNCRPARPTFRTLEIDVSCRVVTSGIIRNLKQGAV